MDLKNTYLVQQYKFTTSVHLDVRLEDFSFALRLQAELCGFQNFEVFAVLDRIIAGLCDNQLRQRLSMEIKLKLAIGEATFTFWEVIRANAQPIETANKESHHRFPFMGQGSQVQGSSIKYPP